MITRVIQSICTHQKARKSRNEKRSEEKKELKKPFTAK
jgi:hypothetical protein